MKTLKLKVHEFLVGSIMVGSIDDATILDSMLDDFDSEIEHVYKMFDSECEAGHQFGIIVWDANKRCIDAILKFLDEEGIWYVTDFDLPTEK